MSEETAIDRMAFELRFADNPDAILSLESVSRFLSAVLSHPPQQPDRADMVAAAALLSGLIYGAQQGEKLNPVMFEAIGVKKRTGKFSADAIHYDSPELLIVIEYLEGQSSYDAAVLELGELFSKGESTAKQILEAIRPKAERAVEMRRMLR